MSETNHLDIMEITSKMEWYLGLSSLILAGPQAIQQHLTLAI